MCRQRLFYSVILWIAFLSAAHAKFTIINADAWLDVVSGELKQPAQIVIEDQIIRDINPASQHDGQIIELDGYTLLPGLIDCHTHLTRDIVPGWREQPVRESEADWALRGARNARLTLEAGFTTVRDLGSYRFADIALMRAINNDMIPGPHMLPCGHAICRTGGHCDFGGYVHGVIPSRPEFGMADGRAEIIKAVRTQIKMGAKVIKVTASGGVTSENTSLQGAELSQEELDTLVNEAHRHNLRVAAHAHSPASIIAALKAGVDSIEHGFLISPEAIDLMLKQNTWLVPTLSANHYLPSAALSSAGLRKAMAMSEQVARHLRSAIQAGVKIAFGTDAAVLPHGRNAEEFEHLMELGMTPLDALRSATLHAAELLNLPDRGRLAAGYTADIIALKGNPLENTGLLKQIEFVMKAGKVYLKPGSNGPT